MKISNTYTKEINIHLLAKLGQKQMLANICTSYHVYSCSTN